MLKIGKKHGVEERLRDPKIECAAISRGEITVNFACTTILVEEAEVKRGSGLLLGVSSGICLDTLQSGVQPVEILRIYTDFLLYEALKTFFGSPSLYYASAVVIDIKRKLCTYHRLENASWDID